MFGFVIDDHFFELLETPTITKAYDIYVRLIQFGFQFTIDDSDITWAFDGDRGITIRISIMDDLETIEIYNRYH